MSRFTFQLATPVDDAALGDLLAATPMEGTISVSFARRPSYFQAAVVDGRRVQVGIVRDGPSGPIIGMGSRATGLRYVDARPTAIGFLSGLRLMDEFRGRHGLLARGYRFLRELHDDGTAHHYLTTIAADNPVAEVLTSARAGLPIYHLCGNYHTLAIATCRFTRNGTTNVRAVKIRPAQASERDAILAFLNSQGPSRQYFPVYESQDLFSGGGLLRGLRAEDILLAVRDGQIIGTLGGWDQRGFKQIIVHDYHGWLSALRPLYNGWAKLRRHPTLPPAGSTLPVHLAAIPVVRDDCRDVFRLMLEAMLHRLAEQGDGHLLVGLHERDPLLPIVRQFAGREYLTKMYLVYWPDEAVDAGCLMQRAPYLELGSL
jgi:hypothetical protein